MLAIQCVAVFLLLLVVHIFYSDFSFSMSSVHRPHAREIFLFGLREAEPLSAA